MTDVVEPLTSFWRTPESMLNVCVSVMEKQPCVYLLSNGKRGTLYVGVTSDLIKRIWQHKNDLAEGFTKQYRVHNLVWFEMHASMDAAIAREKAIKCWKRWWKLDLVEKENADWRDLYPEINR